MCPLRHLSAFSHGAPPSLGQLAGGVLCSHSPARVVGTPFLGKLASHQEALSQWAERISTVLTSALVVRAPIGTPTPFTPMAESHRRTATALQTKPRNSRRSARNGRAAIGCQPKGEGATSSALMARATRPWTMTTARLDTAGTTPAQAVQPNGARSTTTAALADGTALVKCRRFEAAPSGATWTYTTAIATHISGMGLARPPASSPSSTSKTRWRSSLIRCRSLTVARSAGCGMRLRRHQARRSTTRR